MSERSIATSELARGPALSWVPSPASLRQSSRMAALDEHCTYRRDDALDRGPSIGPFRVVGRRGHHHGGVRLEEQDFARRAEAEIDAAVVEAERRRDPFERRHAARTDDRR